MIFRCVLILLAVHLNSMGLAQQVTRITWPTMHASKPVTLARPAADFLPAFRLALKFSPESNIVALALSQPAFLGLTEAHAAKLQTLCAERYALIEKNAAFAAAPSSLAYCFSPTTPTNGLALVYRPQRSDQTTRCLVYLHGYGGSFLWDQHLLAEAFSDRIIISPAFGISSGDMPVAYLNECLAGAEKHLGHRLATPSLIGLSAGGFGALRIYTKSSQVFSRAIIIGAYPPSDSLPQFTRAMSAYFLVGGREPYVQSGEFQRSLAAIRPRIGKLESRILPNVDHYFLLSERQTTIDILQAWLP